MLSSSDSESEWINNLHLHRKQRRFMKRINFDWKGEDCKNCLRLKSSEIEFLVQQISPLIAHKTKRNFALSARQQCLVALRYLATGCNFSVIADAHGIHKSTVCRAVHKVVKAVNKNMFRKIIKWPSKKEDLSSIARGFRYVQGGGIPAVFGCVDGTYVTIKSPKINEEQYINRHGDHSLNVMIICRPKLEIFYLNPK